MTRDEALSLALELAEQGLHVLPVGLSWDDGKQKVNKQPKAGLGGYRNGSTDPRRVNEMFEAARLLRGEEWGVGHWPGAAGLIAIDVDISPEDDRNLDAWAAQASALELPEHPIVITVSGGQQHVFRCPEGVEVGTTHDLDGVDVIRAHLGFAVPPGVHCEWGSWQWDEATRDILAPVAPPALLDRLEVFDPADLGGNGHGGPWQPWDPSAVDSATAEAVEILEEHFGGHNPTLHGRSARICRPGKRAGSSATVGYIAPGVVKIFTSEWAPFEEGKRYDLDDLLALADAKGSGATEPIPEEPGHRVLDDVAEWFRGHVAYASPHHVAIVALWAAHTHALDRAASTPRLVFLSPEPESGKSRNLELLECVTHSGRMVLQISPAALYRWIKAVHPTILLDEIDAVFGPRASKDHEDLRAILNAGHRPGATVPRCEPPSMKVIEFECYAAVAMAGLVHSLPDTIRSRSIRILMRRRAPDEETRHFRERVTRPEGEALRARLAAWVERADIDEEPPLPEGVTDRQADQWEPLLGIADAAGGHWPATARAACTATVGEARGDVEEQSLSIQLLTDVRAAFGDDDRLHTSELLDRLRLNLEAPWVGMDKLSPRWLAKNLKPFGIGSKNVRVGDVTRKGYEAEWFAEAWTRYLPPLMGNRRINVQTAGQRVTPVTHANGKEAEIPPRKGQ